MTREELKNWTISEYNEGTDEYLCYYIDENKCEAGDTAYLFSQEENRLIEIKIVKLIARSDDLFIYDELSKNEDVLLEGEDFYNADTGAEFIVDNDCYLVWFKDVE